MLSKAISFTFILILSLSSLAQDKKTLTIGSKRFTENYIVAEIFAQLLESEGFSIIRKMGMGGTMVAYNALQTQEIDIYPEYTGTIAEAILKTGEKDYPSINQSLKKSQVQMLTPLGFDNSYCVIMKKELSEELNIHSISDLSQHPQLKGAFSFEFLSRGDGWERLKQVYSLENSSRGMDVPLTYEAIDKKKVDFAEAYSTEPLIEKLNFVILNDNKKFFPKYAAVPLIHTQVPQRAQNILNRLKGKLTNPIMMKLNQQAIDGLSIQQVANNYLIQENILNEKFKKQFKQGVSWAKLFERTQTHLLLTCLAVLLATLIAVPFASLFAENKRVSQIVLSFTGILQTIPSIALLTFMIPFFGIGFKPAIVGLFIYSLLPILRNTHTAMTSIDPRIITAAKGIGLYPSEIFFSVKLPLAFPTILAGIRTATILNIGTATLAAFIGAGGLGEPIVTGLALNDTSQVLQGAIPAAVLAIVVDGLFSLTDKIFTKNI